MKQLIIIENWKTREGYILNLDKENILDREIGLNVAAQIYGISNRNLIFVPNDDKS